MFSESRNPGHVISQLGDVYSTESRSTMMALLQYYLELTGTMALLERYYSISIRAGPVLVQTPLFFQGGDCFFQGEDCGG